MDYSNVLGQESSINYLKRTVSNNKQNHSLIFEGKEGMGKMTLAKVYAKSLLCTASEKPCGRCLSCKKFESGNHLDYKVIKPKNKKSITTDEISELLSDAYLIPSEGDNKIYIIIKANLMTPAAQNKLLKILEEPPEYLTIILLCDNISGLLSTILSRCVTIKMKKLSDDVIVEELVKKGIERKKAKEISLLSDGNLGYALDIYNDKKMLDRYEEYKKVFFSIEHSKIDVFSFFDKRRADIADILICWQKILSNCLKIKTGIITEAYSENEINYAKKNAIDDIINKLSYILQTESRLKSNAQYLPTVDWLLSNL